MSERRGRSSGGQEGRQGLLDAMVPAKGGVMPPLTKVLIPLTASPLPLDPCHWVGRGDYGSRPVPPVMHATYQPAPGPPSLPLLKLCVLCVKPSPLLFHTAARKPHLLGMIGHFS